MIQNMRQFPKWAILSDYMSHPQPLSRRENSGDSRDGMPLTYLCSRPFCHDDPVHFL
jgi:hypothetical protein